MTIKPKEKGIPEIIKPRVAEIMQNNDIYTWGMLKSAIENVKVTPNFIEHFEHLLRHDRGLMALHLQSMCYGYAEKLAIDQASGEINSLLGGYD